MCMTCEQCGAELIVTARHPEKRFCNRGCASIYREAHRARPVAPTKKCECGCGGLMPVKGRLGERRYLYRHNPRTATERRGSCELCGQAFSRPRRAWGTMQFCSRACSSASRRVAHSKRKSPSYRRWRKAVLDRDGWACQQCGATDQLHAHHLKSWAEHPAERFEVGNGLTLCVDCHGDAHGRRLAA